MFENSTVNIHALCNSCGDVACCSSECVLTFLHAGDNIQYVNEQFVSCTHFFLYTLLFIKPHKQKSNGVKSGDLGGQLMVQPRPIHLLGKVSLRCCIICRVSMLETVRNRTQVNINIFSWNDRYYDLPEY